MQNPPKIVEVTVTPEYVRCYGFNSDTNCALFHAAKDAGVEVKRVGTTVGIYKNKDNFFIKPSFNISDYNAVKKTKRPFKCLIIPCGR